MKDLGIGLAYSKKIIDLIKAKMECESIYNEFTEFRIIFNMVEKKDGINEIKLINQL